jgi:hypothetical protein
MCIAKREREREKKVDVTSIENSKARIFEIILFEIV